MGTEGRNSHTIGIDTWHTERVVTAILAEDLTAVRTSQDAAPLIAELVDATDIRIRRGGAVHYFGAGASGRIAFLDATESRPTFGNPADLVLAHFPGGDAAILDSTIDAEDQVEAGIQDATALTPVDVAIGITASGSTNYVAAALDTASRRGAFTALITNNPGSSLACQVDLAIILDTGPEALTGSTRLKAGTAAKVVVNAFSTALMIRAGRTWSNLMTHMVTTNTKLNDRALRVLTMATGEDEQVCARFLAEACGELPLALTMLITGTNPTAAARALAAHGSIRAAVDSLGGAR